MLTCKECGFQIEQPRKFCQECGSPLRRKCDRCATELSVNAKFCDECGASQSFSVSDGMNLREESVLEPGTTLFSEQSEDVKDESDSAKKAIDEEAVLAFVERFQRAEEESLLQGYEHAFVGVVETADSRFKYIALYDWNYCVQIFASENPEDDNPADTLSYTTGRALHRKTDPAWLHWEDAYGEEEVSYLDGYDDAFVGLIDAHSSGFGLIALYDWQKCIEILASNLGGVHPSVAEAKLDRTTRVALSHETDPAFLFKFPGFITSLELRESCGDDLDLFDHRMEQFGLYRYHNF